MKWERKTDWFWQRECGRYSVCRELRFADAKDHIGHWVYLAWFKPEPGAMAEPIGDESQRSLEAARAVCAAHLRSQQRHVTAA